MSDVERILRAARRAEAAPPDFAAVLGHGPARARRRVGPPVLAGVAILAALLVGLVRSAPAPAPTPEPAPPQTPTLAQSSAPPPQVFAPPPSTDWLAEPLGVERLRAVPSLHYVGDDYGQY